MSLTMPFGDFKGTPITELPDDYLFGEAAKIQFKVSKYGDAVRAEVQRRNSGGQSTQQKTRQSPPQSAPITTQGYSLTQVKASVFAMKSAYRNSPAKQDVHDALDGLVSLLTEDEIGQARPAPTDGAPKNAYVDYPDPPEDEEEDSEQGIPF